MENDKGVIIDEELDQIEDQLIGIEGEKAEKVRELVGKIRETFESESSNYLLREYYEQLSSCVISLSGIVMAMSGTGEVDFHDFVFSDIDLDELGIDRDELGFKDPSKKVLEKIEKEYEAIAKAVDGRSSVGRGELSFEEKTKRISDFLNILKGISFDDLESAKDKIVFVKQQMADFQIHNDDFTKKLKECEYGLIKGYIEKGEEEKAREYIQSLGRRSSYTQTIKKPFGRIQKVEHEYEVADDYDMRKYLREKIRTLLKEKALDSTNGEVFKKLIECSKRPNLDLDDMDLWKAIISLETGKQFVKEQDKPQKREQKKEQREKKRAQKEDEQKYDVIKIKYYSKDPDGFNTRKIEKIFQKYNTSKKNDEKPIKLILEEGITSVSYEISSKLLGESIGRVESVELPSTLEWIGKSFLQGSSVYYLDLSQTQVEIIGMEAFYQSLIKEIKFPSTLREISGGAFAYTKFLKKVDLSQTQLECICNFAFNSSSIEEIKLPPTLKEIRWASFAGSSLKYIDLSQTQVKSIDTGVFSSSSIEEIKFPPMLQKIAAFAFESTTSLKCVDLSQTQVKIIDEEAFKDSSIEEIKFPSTLQEIGERAFYGAKSLKRLDFSQVQAESIVGLNNAFSGSSIEEIILPSTYKLDVKKIPKGIKVIYADPKRESSSPINQETIESKLKAKKQNPNDISTNGDMDDF